MKLNKLYETLGNCHPTLARGMVFCWKCGAEQSVKAANCLRDGWPMCCGETMRLDEPEKTKKEPDPAIKGSDHD